MPKVDFHTHSTASPDGGISAKQYRHLLTSGQLDCIAITDHDDIDFALQLRQELGDKIIVGEEITTSEGEMIGLFLTKLVKPGQTAAKTAQTIHAQGGLVYIPHPFETVRKGMQEPALANIAPAVDIIEVYNGRTLQNRSRRALDWAQVNKKSCAAGSDAHGWRGVGRTYTTVEQIPTAANLTKLLGNARFIRAMPPFMSRFYPKFNRLRKKVRLS